MALFLKILGLPLYELDVLVILADRRQSVSGVGISTPRCYRAVGFHMVAIMVLMV